MPLFRPSPIPQPRFQPVWTLGQAPIVLSLEEATLTFTGQDMALSVTTTPSVDQPSGGFFVEYERHHASRARAKQKREQAEQQARELKDATEREIAALLHAQEARAAETDDLGRLSALAQRYADQAIEDALNERVRIAFERALSQGNASALLALDRELQRQIEEEEFAVLMAIALDD